MSETIEVQRIEPLSIATMVALVGGISGVIYYLPQAGGNVLLGTWLASIALYGTLGAIVAGLSGAVLATVYNYLARWTGGMEIAVSRS